MADNHRQQQQQLKRREHPDGGKRQEASPVKKARVEHPLSVAVAPADAASRRRRALSVRSNWLRKADHELYCRICEAMGTHTRDDDAGAPERDENPSSSPSTASTSSMGENAMVVVVVVVDEDDRAAKQRAKVPCNVALLATAQREWHHLCVNLINLVNRIKATGERPIFYHNEVTGKELNSTALWAIVDSGVAQTAYWHFCFATGVYYLCVTLRKVLRLALAAVNDTGDTSTKIEIAANVLEALDFIAADANPLGLANKISTVGTVIQWAGAQLARWIQHGRVSETIDFSIVMAKLRRYQAMALKARVKMDEYDGTH